MDEGRMKNCTVCGSANISEFQNGGDIAHWCEDCGTMHCHYNGAHPDATCIPKNSMLHHQVLAFHRRFGQSIGETPHVPDEKTVRFRLSLIAEEFFELLGAASPGAPTLRQSVFQALIEKAPINVDLPALIDALADLDYVIEGFRITLGVNGTPIAEAVHESNMAKLPSYVAAKDAHHRNVTEGRVRSSGELDVEIDAKIVVKRCGAILDNLQCACIDGHDGEHSFISESIAEPMWRSEVGKHEPGNRCWKCGSFLNEHGGTAVFDDEQCPYDGGKHERTCSSCPTYCVKREGQQHDWEMWPEYDDTFFKCRTCGQETHQRYGTPSTQGCTGIVKREDGKIMKPPGWTPPDIEGELKLQGWEP
jgi:predicted HAD superfamily Cof-like phosphohydrolase